MAQPQERPELMQEIQAHKAKPMKARKTRVVVKSQAPVDEDHPVVIELLDLGYELEKCIEAAELYPEDATAAQDYLMEIGEKGELFKGVLIESGTLYDDTKMPLEKPTFEQQESSESTVCEERCINNCLDYFVNNKIMYVILV